ncbi:NACHT domain-containing protein [Actinosynnema sp. NPDC051121]|nr:NACHT domain-containing protein [Saccharothrix sp.]
MRLRLWIVLGVVALVLVLVWLTWWLLGKTGVEDGAGIANVLALGPGVLGAVAGMVALRHGVESGRAPAVSARRLLDAVSQDEARVLARLLGDTGALKAADAGFEQVDAELVRWRGDGGGHGGSAATISSYYQGLTRGRLAVLGEAGSGKTVLVLTLLLDLASAARTALDRDPAGRIRVPVRMNLSGFTRLGDDSPDVVRRRLVEWMAAHLSQVYGVPSRTVKALIADRWVLPVLDGLDEMDPDDGPPARARQVLAALNFPVGPEPDAVVITCRTARYHALAEGEPLEDATAVVMRPLGVEDVVAWLRHRFPDPSRPSEVERRWRPVVQRLRRPPKGRLARCLGNPLRLYLAVTVYRDRASTPGDLNHLDADELDAHLMSRLVPSVVAHHARPGGGHYDPDDVRRWLHTLTRHLASTAAQGRSATDFHVHELWRSARELTGTRAHLAATLLGVGVSIPAALHYLSSHGVRVPLSWKDWVELMVACSAVVFVGWWSTTHADEPPTRITLPRLRRLVPQFFLLCAVAAAFYLAVFTAEAVVRHGPSGFLPAVADAFDDRAVRGLAALMSLWMVLSPDKAEHVVVRPSALMRDALHRDVYVAAVLAAGSVVGFSGGAAIPAAIPTAVLIAPCSTAATSPWPRHVTGLIAYRRRNLLPWRLGRFLDWAHAAGILRLTGTAVQFRHRDLQRHLAA